MAAPLSAAVRVTLVALLLTGASAGSSAAQTPVDSFTQLPGILKIGSVIYVEDETGQRTKGKLRELSGSSLVLVASGRQERSFPADRVVRVTRVDSKLNGFLIGFAAGAVPGVSLGWGINQYCFNESPDHCPSAIFIAGGLLGALGGWIGWAIDGAINGETLVFSKPRASSTSRVRLAPVLTARGTGVVLSVTF